MSIFMTNTFVGSSFWQSVSSWNVGGHHGTGGCVVSLTFSLACGRPLFDWFHHHAYQLIPYGSYDCSGRIAVMMMVVMMEMAVMVGVHW